MGEIITISKTNTTSITKVMQQEHNQNQNVDLGLQTGHQLQQIHKFVLMYCIWRSVSICRWFAIHIFEFQESPYILHSTTGNLEHQTQFNSLKRHTNQLEDASRIYYCPYNIFWHSLRHTKCGELYHLILLTNLPTGL